MLLLLLLLNERGLDVEIVVWPRFCKQPWLARARPPSSLVGVVAAVNVDPYLLTLQRATQTKPKGASSARLNERINRGPEVVLRPAYVNTNMLRAQLLLSGVEPGHCLQRISGAVPRRPPLLFFPHHG